MKLLADVIGNYTLDIVKRAAREFANGSLSTNDLQSISKACDEIVAISKKSTKGGKVINASNE